MTFSRYFSTLDGHGQSKKHQLLLSPVLHPDAMRGGIKEVDWDGGGAQEAAGGAAGVAGGNLLVPWLGRGALHCLQVVKW